MNPIGALRLAAPDLLQQIGLLLAFLHLLQLIEDRSDRARVSLGVVVGSLQLEQEVFVDHRHLAYACEEPKDLDVHRTNEQLSGSPAPFPRIDRPWTIGHGAAHYLLWGSRSMEEPPYPMRALPLSFLFACGIAAHAQLMPGVDAAEVRDMSALCTTHTFSDLYGDDTPIIPTGYERVYVSPALGLDNQFQVFRRGTVGVVEIRGSTANALSWMANMHASMIPARGTIQVAERAFPYHFVDDTAASVHAGYALGISFIADGVVAQVQELAGQGVHDVIITGHSQGGALALLLRAFLEHVPRGTFEGAVRFKTYAFAHPMVGNKAFNDEYVRRFQKVGLGSYSIVNPQDPVIRMPVRVDDGSLGATELLQSMLFGREGFNARSTMQTALTRLFANQLVGLSSSMSGSIEKRIAGAVGEVHMPPYRAAMNYQPMAAAIELEPFPYPLILQDSSILANDSIMRVEPRGADGVFMNRDLYRRSPSFYQHKPYNYYVAVLRRYFPQAYEQLDRKQLPENL